MKLLSSVNFDDMLNTIWNLTYYDAKLNIKPENLNLNPKNLHPNHNLQKSTVNLKFQT
jgi:hypothetical protein